MLSSVCLICHAADCTETKRILKTRTRGGENERETKELRGINGIEGEGMGKKQKEKVLEEGAGCREKDQIKK